MQYIYNKQIGIAFIGTIKVIPAKVFGKWGVGKRTFFQKGFFPTEQFCNNLFPKLTYRPLLKLCEERQVVAAGKLYYFE